MNVALVYCELLLILSLKINIIYCLCEPKRKEFGPAFIDRVLLGPALSADVAQSEIDCQFQCHYHDLCLLYNYNTRTRQCKLLDGRSTDFKIVYRKTWIFKTLKCEKDPCKNAGSCYMIGGVKCLCQCSWSGQYCDVPVTADNRKNIITFPRKSISDTLVLDSSFVNVKKFTLSLWVQIDRSAPPPFSVVSYATSTEDNAILVYVSRTVITLFLGGSTFNFNEEIVDSQWHHICFSWKSIDGQLKLHIDGIKKGETVAKIGYILKSGAFVIGQDQDSVKGGYQANQALQGNVSSINMWDRVFTEAEISELAISCPIENGNILKWDDLKGTRTGALEESCSFSFCDSQ